MKQIAAAGVTGLVALVVTGTVGYAEPSNEKYEVTINKIPYYNRGERGRNTDKPEELGAGKKKDHVAYSLSLGNKGSMIGGHVSQNGQPMCFVNVEGFDLYVQEPVGISNIPSERFRVSATPDLDPYTNNWVLLGEGETTDENKGIIGFELGKTLKKAYWVKIEDLGSGKSSSTIDRAGVDVGTIILKKLCNEHFS